MWLFTAVGFFSVVTSNVEGEVAVRARFRDDLERLRVKYLPALGPTLTNRGTDYPFRAFVSKEKFGAALETMAKDIDYSNFKNRIATEFGEERHDLYTQVWAILRRASPKR